MAEERYTRAIRCCLESQPQGASFGDLCSWLHPPLPRDPYKREWAAFFDALQFFENLNIIDVEREAEGKIKWVRRGPRWRD